MVFELDGRAYRTIFTLFTRPGFLTREYFSGRRMQYTPPLRLFLIISISFFLLVGMVTSLRFMQQSLIEQSAAEPGLEETAEAATEETTDPTAVAPEIGVDGLNITFTPGTDGEQVSDEDLDELRQLIGSFRVPFLSAEGNQNLQTVLSAQVEANIDQLLEDPADFFIGSLEYITFFMLLMMPVLALIQMVLTIMCRRYYVEHLVLTVHNHTFFIVAVFLTMVIGTLADSGIPVLTTLLEYVNIGITIWIFVYLYLSLKFYFQRGYLLTGVIFVTTSIAYAIVLGIGIAGFMLLLFIFA